VQNFAFVSTGAQHDDITLIAIDVI